MKFGSRPRARWRALGLGLALHVPLAVLAQAAPAAKAASDAAGLERAQRQADAVFHWIKLNADKGADRNPRPAAVPVAAPPPAVRRVAAAAPAPSTPAPAAAVTATALPARSSAAPAPLVARTDEPTVAAQSVSAGSPEAPAVTVAAEAAEPIRLAAASPSSQPSAALQAALQASEPAPAHAPAADIDDSPIKLLSKVEPSIPRQLQSSLRTGSAQVRFTIEPNGTVSDAVAIKATHARLGTAAVDAIKQWRFEPIKRAREVGIEVGFNNE